MKKVDRKKLIALSVGALLGILLIGTLRLFLTQAPIATHYHANFAVFINGQRIDLTDDKYMEDVESCKPDFVPLQPEERVHMHNNDHDVVHIHNKGVTWGHFMENIGFSFGEKYLTTDANYIYRNTGSRTLKFILNGESVPDPSNYLINSEDRLLISFGAESVDTILSTQYEQVLANAHEHNEHPDPGSCSGEIRQGFWTELRKALLW